MSQIKYNIREALSHEHESLGQIMVKVYSQLDGFPSPEEQPQYYHKLANIGDLTKKPSTKIIVAISPEEQIMGGLVYFSDMKYYGSGGTATSQPHACGFRLLAVDAAARGLGIGKALTQYCLDLAKEENQKEMIIHSTKSMQVAWKMYEKIGFIRSEDLDFMQGELQVYGFRLTIY